MSASTSTATPGLLERATVELAEAAFIIDRPEAAVERAVGRDGVGPAIDDVGVDDQVRRLDESERIGRRLRVGEVLEGADVSGQERDDGRRFVRDQAGRRDERVAIVAGA